MNDPSGGLMNLDQLRSALDHFSTLRSEGPRAAEWLKAWQVLFGLGRRGLLTSLAGALRLERAGLAGFSRTIEDWFRSRAGEEFRAVRLYVGVAAALANGGEIRDLEREFGVGLVADARAELEGAVGCEESFPAVYRREIERLLGDPLWPWPDRKPRFSVLLPLVATGGAHGNGAASREGLAAWMRLDWVERPDAMGEGHVYLAPAQMAVRRTAPSPSTPVAAETSWWDAERRILAYLAGRLPGGAVGATEEDGLAPVVLPLTPAKGARPGGDIRWWLTMESGAAVAACSGDSFGLGYTLGLVRLLGRAGAGLPPGWERLAEEELMTGVLGMAAVDGEGRLQPVGRTYEKVAASIPTFVRRGGRTIHTVVAARAQRPQLQSVLDLDVEGWLGGGREVRFLFADTVDEAIEQLVGHLKSFGKVDRAIRRYREAREEEWRRRFAEPGAGDESGLQPYVESQGIRLLTEGVDAKTRLNIEAFQMPRDEGGGGVPSGGAAARDWKPVTREALLERFCGLTPEGKASPAWTVGAEGPEAIRLLCVSHDAGQGKSEFLRWMERKLGARLPAGWWVVLIRVDQVCLGVKDLLERLAGQLGLASTVEILGELENRLEEGRIVFLLDGLDEVPGGPGMERLADLIRMAAPRCRFVLAGRPHALGLNWDRLFQPLRWRFLLLDYFTEAEQKLYLGDALYEGVTGTIEVPKELLAVPRALFYVRQLAGMADAQWAEIRSPSGVYLHAVDAMVKEGVSKARAAQGINPEQAMRLLSAMAFEMVRMREFKAVEPGGMEDFLGRVAERYVRAKGTALPAPGGLTHDEDWLRGTPNHPGPLRYLAAMNEGLNGGLLESGCPDRIQWRNRSLQEFFAGHWLAKYCLKEDQGLLRGMLFIEQDENTHDYRWMWRFLAEMPEKKSHRERWVQALEPVYLPDEFEKSNGVSKWKRSTEVIWRTWERMERDPDGGGVIARFCQEFQQLLADPTREGHEIARNLMANFRRCPKDPEADNQPFQMGSPAGEVGRDSNEVQHEVRVSPFRMGRYVVTEEEYALFEPGKAGKRGRRHPVVEVSWWDAWVYGKWAGCRLATEAEWEYACRAGSGTAYCHGDDPSQLGEYAWYDENSNDQTHPVGEKRPNGWGLHDMHGLVWEWCKDWYGDHPSGGGGVLENPVGPESGARRVFRGGGWGFGARVCRSASRHWRGPGFRGVNLGFRLALSSVRSA